MKKWFSFKNLIKRAPNTKIPIEFIGFGVGLVIIIILGNIAGNMHLQEQLYIEGAQKSLQMFTEEELREYGDLYKDLSLEFQNKIGAYTQDYANRTNRAGEKIHYGIYNHEHPDGNRNKIKAHNNGANVNKAEEGHEPDIDDSKNTFNVDYSYIDSDEFKNGVTIKYAKTTGRADGESNFKDILAAVSMILDQRQGQDNESITDLKRKVPDLIRRLFRITHTFSGESTELYPCEKGCRVLFYYCNEVDNRYKDTGIDLQPFQVNPHDDFEDYSDEDFELIDPEDECVICGHNGKGCELDSAPCYHSFDEDEENGCEHYMSSRGECGDLAVPHYICEGHEVSDGEGGTTTEYCDTETGCEGHYHCPGHEHYNCNGHFYVCCMGHTDVIIKVKIMYLQELINILQNGIPAGE